jgi:hypothetical protein
MARPSKYSPPRAAKIIEGLKAGMTRTAAAGLVDIDVSTLDAWRQRFPSFAAQVTVAEQQAEARYTTIIARAANDGDWQAAKYWLSRRRRKDWGESLHIQLDQEITALMEQIAGADAHRTDSN